MPSIPCYVADFNLSPFSPHLKDLSLRGRAAGEYISEAAGAGKLDVGLDWSRRGVLPGLVSMDGVYEGQLLSGLASLLGPNVGTSAVGLLVSDVYQPAPGQYGMMFDLDGNGALGPRRGCAIFLDALKLAAGSLGDAALAEFVAFTAIHELGHVFNLWHVPGSGTFMEPHPDPGALGSLTFDPKEQAYLALAADPENADFVLPGGSPFNSRPHGWPGEGDSPFLAPADGRSKIGLRIGLSHSTFWSFEPVELEVEVRLRAAAKAGVEIPNEIDPGYPSFQIWITTPHGERFRFRSQTRFCRSNGTVRVSMERPFCRDISIFRGAGGYTFREPGTYSIQAMLRLLSGRFVMSNAERCEVLPAEPESPSWAEAMACLQADEARHLLRFKRGLPSAYGYSRLRQFADSTASAETAAAIHYSLGRAMIRSAEGFARGQSSTEFRQKGAEHLLRAVGCGPLSERRKGFVRAIEEAGGLSVNPGGDLE